MDRPAKRSRTKAEEQLVECIRCGTLTNHELDQCDQCRQALANIPRSYNRRSRGSHSLLVSEHIAPDGPAASNSIQIGSHDEYDGFKYGIDDDESGDYSDDGILSGTEGVRERRRKRPASRSFLSSYILQTTQSTRQRHLSVDIPARRRQNRPNPSAAATHNDGSETIAFRSQDCSSATFHVSRPAAPASYSQATAPQVAPQLAPAVVAADNVATQQINDQSKALQAILDDFRELNRLRATNDALTDEMRDLRSEVQSLKDERAVVHQRLAEREAEVSEFQEELQMCKDEVSRAQVTIGDLEARIRTYDGLVAQIMAVRGLPGLA